jgi:hypothetical protein
MASNQRGLVQQKRISRKPYFVGFNTVNQPLPPYSLTNIELVKRDLENHFATPIGARVMLPDFGTRIYDAMRVVGTEPRVQLVTVEVFQEDQALNVVMSLLFKPESVVDNLFVTFSLKDRETF